MTAIVTFWSQAQRDVRSGYESWRVLSLASVASLTVTLLYLGIASR